jgi:hypothetical protein
MKNSCSQNTDRSIDQLLHALGNIEPPTRLEERTAERVAARLSAATGRDTSRRFYFAASSVAALAVLILAIAALHSRPKPAAIAQLPQAPVLEPQFATQPRKLVAVHPTPSQHALPVVAPTLPIASTDPDTIALAETLAPSHPAPPLPLTSQERLMLRILRSGEQEEIAALIPAERDALFAQDQAAFNEYFAPKNQPANTGDQK